MTKEYVLALDQGTTSSRAIVFGKDGQLIETFGVIDHTVYRQMQSAILDALNEDVATEETIDDSNNDNSHSEDATENATAAS